MTWLMAHGKLLPTLLLGGMMLWELQRLGLAVASQGWRVTTGRVHQAFVDAARDPEFGYSYSARVRYSYVVRGVSFESTRMSYRLNSPSGFKSSSRQLHGLVGGGEVAVYYDPVRPSRSVLVRGWSASNLLGIVLLLAFPGFVALR